MRTKGDEFRSGAIKDFANAMTQVAFGMNSVEAKRQKICIDCKQPVSDKNIHSEAGWREYAISALCEDCFDKIVSG